MTPALSTGVLGWNCSLGLSALHTRYRSCRGRGFQSWWGLRSLCSIKVLLLPLYLMLSQHGW
ncbi:hypothetical protein H6G96_32745 [Nostoc sp. FACHB-892]|uniref:hypothetical protein n=1 Tax=Nostoc sp. FACHB-892 TaxID=2692843 RepID=UPI0016868955|nr:hypothetical protein [Nostoc sp. FACHB-892]MBD2730957.1 hypothetical protein [Nostoc sp. FACHB-892]